MLNGLTGHSNNVKLHLSSSLSTEFIKHYNVNCHSFIHPVHLARFHCFANRTKQLRDRSVMDLIALRLITSILRLLNDRSPCPDPALRPGSGRPRGFRLNPIEETVKLRRRARKKEEKNRTPENKAAHN